MKHRRTALAEGGCGDKGAEAKAPHNLTALTARSGWAPHGSLSPNPARRHEAPGALAKCMEPKASQQTDGIRIGWCWWYTGRPR